MILVKKGFTEFSEVKISNAASGHFTFVKHKVDNSGNIIPKTRMVVAEFDNLILNQGLNRIGTAADWLTACHVGTGTATPAVTDVSLASYLAGTSTRLTPTAGSLLTPEIYLFRVDTYRFAVGAATGNLTEVGIGWTTSGSTLFSRALILDGLGNPTTITVLSDESLDVIYEIRYYMPQTDQTGNITITGVGTLTYTLRAGQLSSISATAAIGGLDTGNTARTYVGSISAAGGTPGGASSLQTSSTNAAYSNNSYQRAGTITWGLSAGTVSFNSLMFRTSQTGSMGIYQMQFSSAIPKTSLNTFIFNATHIWSRR